MQELFTGNSGFLTLQEGFLAYQLVKRCYETHVGPMSRCRGILDFGCGWGRTIRFFLKDVRPEKLTGVDHLEEAIQSCRGNFKWCKFTVIRPYPPMPWASESFELIYLYSVFSHLPEEMHWTWLEEFRRLLIPGGMLIATTRRRDFIEECKTLREDPALDEMSNSAKYSAKAFLDADGSLSAYDGGEFCFSSHGEQGRWSFWGEACISKAYVERHWSKIFDICDFIDDRKVCLQNVIVVRKRV
jgi:SAM-dependent methyltransferase